MAALSVTSAWNEAAEFVKREARLLFPIAFMLIALPGGILQLLLPPPVPGRAPEAGAWLLVLPMAAVLGVIGTIALSFLALRPGVSVAEALQRGLRRCLPLIGASMMILLAILVLMFPVLILIGVLIGPAAPVQQPTPAMALIPLLLIVLGLAASARLVLMTPIAAAEDAGPLTIIRRSWGLTRGRFWKLYAFLLLILLVFIVLSAVVAAVGGLVVVLLAGQPEPGSLSAFLIILAGTLLNMVATVYVTALVARIYAQLAGNAPQDVFA